MLATACRTLGNAAEAEDIVQDAWLRWRDVDRDLVRNASALLTTTTKRLAINRVRTARSRHEQPMDAWLADPVHADADPGTLTERSQALESALRLLFERPSPRERAAYLLREAFNYSYEEIARVVRVSEESCRQLVTRARKHLAEEGRGSMSEAGLRRFVGAFLDATQGDLAGLEAVLSADIADALASNVASRRRTLAKRNDRAKSPSRRHSEQ
jgi:RNA polymerase sigma-70 factor (ECF subfamily)